MVIPLFSIIFLLFTSIPSTSTSSSHQNSTSFDEEAACKMLDLCHKAPSIVDYENCLMMQKTHIMVLKAFQLDPNPHPSNPTLPFTVEAIGHSIKLLSERSEYLDCLDLQCVCPHLKGEEGPGKWDEEEKKCRLKTANSDELKIAHRKEIRMLTDVERQKFFDALNKLKHDGLYDAIAESHMNPRYMPGAHHGPGFAPWHREYLKRMELALRRVDPDVVLPYWDSSLDSILSEPRDSVLWTEHFFGKMSDDGRQIMDGPFKDWKMLKGNENLNRNVGKSGSAASLFGLDSIEKIAKINNKGILAIPFCHDEPDFVHLELIHNGVHVFIGGAMQKSITAPADPIFFLHHAFVDLIWEEWRQNQQTREEREKQYPTAEKIKECEEMEAIKSANAHYLNATMTPFNYATMETGLKNFYTDSFYNYAKRPHCTAEQECNSPYLFCNREHGEIHVCVSKIRVGGDCSRFQHNSDGPCYYSECIDGKCAVQPETETDGKLMLSNKMTISENDMENKTRFCYDSHECCQIWSHFGGCHIESQLLNRWCPGSCGYDGCVLPENHRNNEWEDKHPRCFDWVYHKPEECEFNKHWMNANCPAMCNKCPSGNREKCQLDLFNHCREHFPQTAKLDAWLDGLNCEKNRR